MSYFVWLDRKTWRAFWIALRRAPRDPRARRNLFRFSLSFALLVVWLGYNYFFFRGAFYDLGRGALLLAGVGILWLLFLIVYPVVSERRERRALERDSPAVVPEMKRALFREACLVSILLERLGSEGAMEKEIPPEIVVVTRRVLLDRLTTLDLREGLEPWILDLLLAPDGHWTPEQKQRAIPAWECLAVYRWALGLAELRELTVDPKYSIEEARSLFEAKEPDELHVLASWDLRPARNLSGTFFHRCWAELVARREVATAREEDVEQALAVRAEIEEAGYSGDYLVGARTIPELDKPLLMMATRRAYNRWQFLSLLVDVLAGDAPSAQLRKFLAHYFAPAEVAEALFAEAPE
jgi:hypothetical protein